MCIISPISRNVLDKQAQLKTKANGVYTAVYRESGFFFFFFESVRDYDAANATVLRQTIAERSFYCDKFRKPHPSCTPHLLQSFHCGNNNIYEPVIPFLRDK